MRDKLLLLEGEDLFKQNDSKIKVKEVSNSLETPTDEVGNMLIEEDDS